MTKHQAVFSGLTALLLVLSPAAHAAEYIVAPNGSDSNPGSLSAPLATLGKALTLAGAGDTVYLRGGSYGLSSSINVSKSGASGNLLKIHAYPGERPVLDAAAMSSTGYYSGWPLVLNNASWVHLKGLEITNGPMGGLVILGASHHNLIEGLDVHHNGRLAQWEGKGISLYGSSADNLLLNNDSHHNRDLQDSNADGFQVSTTGAGNVLRGNRAWRNSDDGFDFFNIFDNSLAAPLTLEGNWAFENGYLENGTASIGDGNGFKLGGRRANTSGSSGGHTLRFNVSWGNRNKGFDENDATQPLTLHSNTAYANGRYDYAFWTTAHVLRNNLAYAGALGVSVCCGAAGSVADHNSWTLPVSVNAADFQSLVASSATAARAADGSLPTSGFLRLAAGSDLVDAGVNVGLSYQGSAPDLGAYEQAVGTGDTNPPSTPSSLSASADSASGVQLVWSAATDNVGVSGYRVLRNGGVVGSSSAISFRDTGLSARTTYNYQVQALDAAGNASALSSTATATTWRFSLGQRVKLSGKTTVYASVGGNVIGSQGKGAWGGVTAGPVFSGGDEWWQFDFDSGVDGWLRFAP